MLGHQKKNVKTKTNADLALKTNKEHSNYVPAWRKEEADLKRKLKQETKTNHNPRALKIYAWLRWTQMNSTDARTRSQAVPA